MNIKHFKTKAFFKFCWLFKTDFLKQQCPKILTQLWMICCEWMPSLCGISMNSPETVMQQRVSILLWQHDLKDHIMLTQPYICTVLTSAGMPPAPCLILLFASDWTMCQLASTAWCNRSHKSVMWMTNSQLHGLTVHE